ncbi:hypothetical protein D3C75_1223720 [compost metagenome]
MLDGGVHADGRVEVSELLDRPDFEWNSRVHTNRYSRCRLGPCKGRGDDQLGKLGNGLRYPLGLPKTFLGKRNTCVIERRGARICRTLSMTY